MGGILLILIGLGWFLWQILKDACISHVPKGTYYRQTYIDSYK